VVDAVEALLGAACDLQDVVGLALLATVIRSRRQASRARVNSRAASTPGVGTTTPVSDPAQQPGQQLGVFSVGLDPV
jgi:hypothetical protein